MKFKKFFVILTLFIVLFISVNSINAVSDDSMDNITSEIDDSIMHNDDVVLNAIENDTESNELSSTNEDIILQKQGSDTSKAAVKSTSSKSKLKIKPYSNFVKDGNKFYMRLVDENGNPVANKKLTINFNGKNDVKTTNKNGDFFTIISSSKSIASFKVTAKGDKKYYSLSKNINIHVLKSFSITIGNSKLLTNGYLRVYLNGPTNLISHKYVKIIIGKKVFKKTTGHEGVIVIKPKLAPKYYNIQVKHGKLIVYKRIKCVEGDVLDPLEASVPTRNGVPNVDLMPFNYILGNNNAKYTLDKSQYLETIKRDSYSLYLFGKLPKYTFFKVKSSPNVYHIMKREKWNVIERAINTEIVKKNKYHYWPKSITVSLQGRAYTYTEVRDIQNTEYTCGSAASSVCSQALRNFYSEKFFEVGTNSLAGKGVDIPVLKKFLDENNFQTYYFDGKTINDAVKQTKKGYALVAFLSRHYVAVIDVSPDGKKILVSNSYGDYDVGGLNKVPTGWVSLSYFKTKFGNTGLVVKSDYKLSKKTERQVKCFYLSMGVKWQRQNTNEWIPEIGL